MGESEPWREMWDLTTQGGQTARVEPTAGNALNVMEARITSVAAHRGHQVPFRFGSLRALFMSRFRVPRRPIVLWIGFGMADVRKRQFVRMMWMILARLTSALDVGSAITGLEADDGNALCSLLASSVDRPGLR